MTLPAQHRPEPVDVTPGMAPPCEPDCEFRSLCETCGYPLCPEHEPDAVSPCGEQGAFHHSDDCAARGCGDCDDAARWDAAEAQGDWVRDGGYLDV